MMMILLLIASYIFYAFWDLYSLPILIVISLFTYYCGALLNKLSNDGNKDRGKRACICFVAVLIGILCFFKYSGIYHLPVGMSFYMLMAISFLVDSYRKKFTDYPSLIEAMVYLSFFPTVISGPIMKAHELIPQFKMRKKLTHERLSKGVWLLVIGLFMKLVLADRLAVSVDKVYSAPAVYSGLTLFLTSIGYSLRLFFDFAGYSNMALGGATIIGFDLTENFNLPYLATNPSEFWKRWHISLSSFLKEYVYIPLGGSRKGAVRTYVNIMIVMIVSGLWHGSTVNFLVWGMLHGLGQIVHRFFSIMTKDAKPFPGSRILSVILNFLFVNFLWIPFSVPTLSDAMTICKRIVTFADGSSYYYVYTILFGIMLLIVQFVAVMKNNGNDPVVKPLPLNRMYGKVIFLCIIISIAMFAYFGDSAFIYAQF